MNRKTSQATIYCPILLNLRGRRCVVVGGGNVALRKVKMLLEAGAKVTVISPRLHPEIEKLSGKRLIQLIQRDYKAGDLKKAVILVAGTDVKEVNRKVTKDGKEAGVLVNVADDPKPSDFIFPSFFRRGDLTVAVSTAGMSPALARKIRAKLEKSLGEEYASLLFIIGEVRSTMKRKGYIVDAETWQDALDLDPLIRLVKARQWRKAKTFLLNKLKVEQ
jgi:siroheme synthase-like protein